jgi:hypothetical protein
MLDLDNDGKETPGVDRMYSLNQRPYLPGLRHVIWKENGATTGEQDTSEGRGAIRYVATSGRKRVRVDTYLIPLQEISRHIGETIGICYYCYSVKPPLGMNSVNLVKFMPTSMYQKYMLSPGFPIDALSVPEGRNDNPGAQQ